MNKIVCIFIIIATIQLITSSGISAHDILDKYMDGPTKELFKTYHFIYEKQNDYQLDSFEGVRIYRIFKSNLNYIKQEA